MRVRLQLFFSLEYVFYERGGHNDDVVMTAVRYTEKKTLIKFNCTSYCPGFFYTGVCQPNFFVKRDNKEWSDGLADVLNKNRKQFFALIGT